MSGTYLICDLCGNAGPPAAFLIKQGTRICYVCAEAEARDEKRPGAEIVEETQRKDKDLRNVDAGFGHSATGPDG